MRQKNLFPKRATKVSLLLSFSVENSAICAIILKGAWLIKVSAYPYHEFEQPKDDLAVPLLFRLF